MAKRNILHEQFADLLVQLAAVEATKHYEGGDYTSGHYVDNELYISWKLKARHLLSLACGEGSAHYLDFTKREEGGGWSTNHGVLLQLKAVFLAAQEDFGSGLFASVRSLVQAEVFSSELEQAQELLRGGYQSAAAVITGVVLETTLRQLCDSAGIAIGSLNKMNADLTKAGVYNLLVQKRITALADIRNNAAHGHPDAFTASDVEDMIAKVEAFVTDNL